MDTIPLIGYAEKLSGRPGDTIEFKVNSASQGPFHANLLRIICADPNPAGPGLIEEGVDIKFGGTFPSLDRPFYPGSYAAIDLGDALKSLKSFTVVATLWPTTPDKENQGVISCIDSSNDWAFNLCIEPHSFLGVRLIKGRHSMTSSLKEKLKTRH